LIRIIQIYLKESDILAFLQANENEKVHLERLTIRNINEFKTRNDLFEIENLKIMDKQIKVSVDFSGALSIIIEQIKYLEGNYHNNLDKIVFCFMNSDDFILRSDNDDIFEELISCEVAVYCFLFDTPEESELKRIKSFIKNLDEGYIIIVKNYEIIERAFQNISFSLEKNNNMLNIKFSNHNYIV